MTATPWPLPLGRPGLRVTEVYDACTTTVACADCTWTQPGKPGYHVINARAIKAHLDEHPRHTIEASMVGLERFRLP